MGCQQTHQLSKKIEKDMDGYDVASAMKPILHS